MWLMELFSWYGMGFLLLQKLCLDATEAGCWIQIINTFKMFSLTGSRNPRR